MEKRKKWFKRIVAILVLIYMVYCAFTLRQFDRVWVTWLMGNEPIYKGIINVWNIEDEFSFNPGYKGLLKEYEEDNFGVFITVHNMDFQEAKERYENGERGDIVLYSQNFWGEDKPPFEELKRIDNPLIKTGKSGSDVLAYPLFYDTYTLLVNDDILYEKAIELPTLLDMNYLVNNVRDTGVTDLAVYDYSGALSAFVAGEYNDLYFPFEQKSLNEFSKGEVAMYISSTLGYYNTGMEMPSHSEYDFLNFTDKVRYVSVFSGNNNENKVQCSKEIVMDLMSEDAQEEIAKEAFSSLYGHETIKSVDSVYIMGIFDNELKNEDTVINSIFNEKDFHYIKEQVEDKKIEVKHKEQ